MGYSINWYIENEIIYAAFTGIVTLDELREVLQTGNDLIESSPRPLVHTIIDVGSVTKAVNPLESLNIVRETGTHQRAGWQITIRETSMLVRLGVAMGTSLFKSRYRTFNTLGDAEAFLKTVDPTLNWHQSNRSILVSE